MLLLLTLSGCVTADGTDTTAAGPDAAEDDTARVMRIADDVRQRGDLASAMVLYRRAHVLEPEAPMPLVALGDGFRKRRQYEQAQQAYRRALQLDQGHTEALLGYALLLIETGNAERTVEILKPEIADGRSEEQTSELQSIMGIP